MSLRIVCKARNLSAYMKSIVSTNGRDCLVTNLNPLILLYQEGRLMLIEKLGLRIENSEIVNEIDTEVWKDIHDIMLLAQLEKECEEEVEEISENHSPIDRQADLHMYYASETI